MDVPTNGGHQATIMKKVIHKAGIRIAEQIQSMSQLATQSMTADAAEHCLGMFWDVLGICQNALDFQRRFLDNHMFWEVLCSSQCLKRASRMYGPKDIFTGCYMAEGFVFISIPT